MSRKWCLLYSHSGCYLYFCSKTSYDMLCRCEEVLKKLKFPVSLFFWLLVSNNNIYVCMCEYTAVNGRVRLIFFAQNLHLFSFLEFCMGMGQLILIPCTYVCIHVQPWWPTKLLNHTVVCLKPISTFRLSFFYSDNILTVLGNPKCVPK